MGDAGNFHVTEGYFPTFVPDGPHGNAYQTGGPMAPDPWATAHAAAAAAGNIPHEQPETSGLSSQAFAAGSVPNQCCPTCGNYFQDDAFSTDTSSDDGSSMPGDTDDPVEAYLQYAFARKRWRRISIKYPRRYRKSFKGGKGYRPGAYAAFLPPNSFAGGKGGKGKPGSSFKKRNPKDKNGVTLKCNICQSEEHLWRNCPKRNQSGDGSYATNAIPTANVHVAQPASQQQLALMPCNNMLWGPGHSTSLPGVHFFGTEMENLRSVSQAGSAVSSRKRSSAHEPDATPNAPTKSAARWSPSFFPTATTEVNPEVEPLIANASQPVGPPPTEPAPATILLGVRRDVETPLDEPSEPARPSGVNAAASVSQASVPNASAAHASVPHGVSENVTASDATADDAKFSRMSKQEQQRLRDQSIAGLQNVLQSLDNRSEVGSAVGSQVSNPNMLSGRHVLNLENSFGFTADDASDAVHVACSRCPHACNATDAQWRIQKLFGHHMFPISVHSPVSRVVHSLVQVPQVLCLSIPMPAVFHGGKFRRSQMMKSETRRVHITFEAFELADVMAVLACLWTQVHMTT